MVVIGWSWGGSAAINFTKKLNKEGIKVDLLFTIDPVSRPVPNKKITTEKKDLKVRQWLNFFQEMDTQSVLIGIHGSRITGADNGDKQEVTKEDFDVDVKRKFRVIGKNDQGIERLYPDPVNGEKEFQGKLTPDQGHVDIMFVGRIAKAWRDSIDEMLKFPYRKLNESK